MLITKVRNASEVNYGLVASIFREAYPAQASNFSTEYFEWRYSKCFGSNTIIIEIYDNEIRIGQAVIFLQSINIAGNVHQAAQLADLVVHPSYRSMAAVRQIYNELKAQLVSNLADFFFTLPNEKSLKLNKRFLNLQKTSPLSSRVSFGVPTLSRSIEFCQIFSGEYCFISKVADIIHLQPTEVNEIQIKWDIEHICNRLSDPRHKFGIVSTPYATMITSKRKLRGVPCTLIMGLFCAGEHYVARSEWHALVNASTKLFGNPLHLYIGFNKQLEGEYGIKLPNFMRSASRALQISIPNKSIKSNSFTRLELIDIDIF